MNKYTKILTLLIISVTAALGTLLTKKAPLKPIFNDQIWPIKEQPENKDNSDLFNIWQNYYDFEVKKALLEIREEFGISPQQWNMVEEKIIQLKANDPMFANSSFSGAEITAYRSHPDHPFTQKVITLLTKNGLNSHVVDIIFDPAECSPASTTQHYQEDPESVRSVVIINPERFGKRDSIAQDAILSHEIIHLIFYDAIEEGWIWSLLHELGYKPKDWNNAPSMIKYRHLKELRADQLGAIRGGLDIAHAMKSDLTKMAKFDTTSMHPASGIRAAHMDVVLNHLRTT